jgi:hypothetical protein
MLLAKTIRRWLYGHLAKTIRRWYVCNRHITQRRIVRGSAMSETPKLKRGTNAIQPFSPSANAPARPIVKALFGDSNHPLVIGDRQLQCYVLEDHRRVIVQTSVLESMGMTWGGGTVGTRGSSRLARFFSGRRFAPYVSRELFIKLESPILIRLPHGSTAYGYEATILSDLCDVVLRADRDGALQQQQSHIVEQCVKLKTAFANVGIVALVDEATGFQKFRADDALAQILARYIAPELLPWQRRFPEEYYRELARLWGFEWDPTRRKNPPQYVGKLTNDFVYARLAPGVLEELRRKNPVVEGGRRRGKHHQLLTEDIGNPHLEKHLVAVTTLLKVSKSKKQFLAYLDEHHRKVSDPRLLLPNLTSDKTPKMKNVTPKKLKTLPRPSSSQIVLVKQGGS